MRPQAGQQVGPPASPLYNGAARWNWNCNSHCRSALEGPRVASLAGNSKGSARLVSHWRPEKRALESGRLEFGAAIIGLSSVNELGHRCTALRRALRWRKLASGTVDWRRALWFGANLREKLNFKLNQRAHAICRQFTVRAQIPLSNKLRAAINGRELAEC